MPPLRRRNANSLLIFSCHSAASRGGNRRSQGAVTRSSGRRPNRRRAVREKGPAFVLGAAGGALAWALVTSPGPDQPGRGADRPEVRDVDVSLIEGRAVRTLRVSAVTVDGAGVFSGGPPSGESPRVVHVHLVVDGWPVAIHSAEDPGIVGPAPAPR